MLHAIIRDAVKNMSENTVRIANSDQDAKQQLVALTMWYFEELFNDQEAFAILYNERIFPLEPCIRIRASGQGEFLQRMEVRAGQRH